MGSAASGGLLLFKGLSHESHNVCHTRKTALYRTIDCFLPKVSQCPICHLNSYREPALLLHHTAVADEGGQQFAAVVRLHVKVSFAIWEQSQPPLPFFWKVAGGEPGTYVLTSEGVPQTAAAGFGSSLEGEDQPLRGQGVPLQTEGPGFSPGPFVLTSVTGSGSSGGSGRTIRRSPTSST